MKTRLPTHDRLVWAGYRALLRIATGEPEWAMLALRLGITAAGDDLDALPADLYEPASDAFLDALEALENDPPDTRPVVADDAADVALFRLCWF